MNLAHLISMSRIAFGILGIVSLIEERPLFFLAFLLLGVISDFLDGKVARWRKTLSGRGKLLDLFCDQVFEASLAIGLFVVYQLPLYYFIVLAVRICVSIALLIKKMEEVKRGPGGSEFRIHSLLTIIVFFFYGFSLAIQNEAPPLATGLSTIALPYVLAPIGALMEVMTCMKFIPQLFDQRG